MKMKLLSAMVAVAAFAAAPAYADFKDFCVNPTLGGKVLSASAKNCASPSDPGNNTGFSADVITGSYQEKLQFGLGNTFAATIVADWDGFTHNTTPLAGGGPNGTGLEAVYNLYAVITAVGTTNAGQTVFQPTSATITLYLDADFGTATGLPNIGNDLSFTPGGNDIALLTGTYDSGIGDINAAGQQFDIGFRNITLTAAGDGFFIAPRPFYIKAFADGDIDGNSLVPVGPPGLFSASGQLSAVFDVPEPTALALVGLALVGVGAASRRKASLKA